MSDRIRIASGRFRLPDPATVDRVSTVPDPGEARPDPRTAGLGFGAGADLDLDPDDPDDRAREIEDLEDE